MIPFIIIYFILGLGSAEIAFWLMVKLNDSDPELVAFVTMVFWPVMLPIVIADYLKIKKKKDMITKCEKCNCYSCRCQQIDFISKPKEQRCAECGGMFLESKMKPVVTITLHASAYNKTEFYCVTHQSPYDKKYLTTHGIEYFKTIPAHEVEVDQNGKEIKKK